MTGNDVLDVAAPVILGVTIGVVCVGFVMVTIKLGRVVRRARNRRRMRRFVRATRERAPLPANESRATPGREPRADSLAGLLIVDRSSGDPRPRSTGPLPPHSSAA